MATSVRRSDTGSRQDNELSLLLSSLVDPVASVPKMPQQPPPVPTPSFAIPPHIMGRNVDNPVDDLVAHRRGLQKPRLGVRVPYRNLTSQIVTQDELARELLERSLKRRPVHDTPEGGDLFFAKKLTQRLANHLAPSAVVSGLDTKQASSKSCFSQPSDTLRLLSPNYAMVPESTGIPDTSDLLAILEGDGDPDWVSETKASTSLYTMGSPNKLDPLLEKELALKQLMEFQTSPRRKRAEKAPRKPRPRIKKEVDGTVLNQSELMMDPENNNSSNIVSSIQTFIEQTAPGQKKMNTKRKLTDPNSESSAKKSRLTGKKKPITEAVASRHSGDGNHKTESKHTKKPRVSKNLVSQKTNTTPVNYKASSVKFSRENEVASSMSTGSTENGIRIATSNLKPKKPNALGGSVGKTNVMPSRKKKTVTNSTLDFNSSGMSNGNHNSRNIDVVDVPSMHTLKRVTPFAVGFPVVVREDGSRNHSQSSVSPLRTYSSRKRVTKPDDQKRQGIVDVKQNLSTVEVSPMRTAELSSQKAEGSSSSPKKKDILSTSLAGVKKRFRMREIEKLLQDEGAINLLYDAEHGESKRRSGVAVEPESISSSPRRIKIPLKSARRKKKDLLLKTRLVKNAVLRLCNSASSSSGPALSRSRRYGDTLPFRLALARTQAGLTQQKLSQDAVRSPPALTPVDPPSPSQAFMYPPRQLSAEASRIIRRHSSSSNFSSRSTSPTNTRIDVHPSADNAENTPHNQFEMTVTPSSSSSTQNAKVKTGSEARKKGVPIFVRKLETAQTYKGKKNTFKTPSAPSTNNDSIFNKKEITLPEQKSKDLKTMSKIQSQISQKVLSDSKKKTIVPIYHKKNSPADKIKLKPQMTKTLQKGLQKPKMPKLKKSTLENGLGKSRRDEMPELSSCLAAAASAFAAEAAEGAGPSHSLPPPASRQPLLKKEPRIAAPLSPNASTYSNLIKTLENESQKQRRKDGEENIKQRSSIRQNAGTFHYREISLRRYENLVQIILTPASTKMKNALNLQVLRELRDALVQLRRDESCRAVLLTSTGSSFCQGLDFSCLLHTNADRRKSIAQELAHGLKEFLKCLALFNKPIVAGVHGAAVGLGVTMLPFFDMVFASDKATFYTPYARLGQVPEGAAILTLPHMFGNAVTSELLFGCRKLTASEALHFGLVTRILWPDRFQEELIPIIRSMANQSAQSMESTKALLRHSLRTKLDAALESESHLLVQHWSSAECQANFRRFLDGEDIGLQRQRLDA